MCSGSAPRDRAVRLDSQGLPIGLMICTKGFDEATALRVGYAYDWPRLAPSDARLVLGEREDLAQMFMHRSSETCWGLPRRRMVKAPNQTLIITRRDDTHEPARPTLSPRSVCASRRRDLRGCKHVDSLRPRGVDIHVVTATRGERGDLGTGDLTIARRDLPAVREAELRAVLALYGAHPPILLDYRDQELSAADFAAHPRRVAGHGVGAARVVLTFGPSGISGHEDHKPCTAYGHRGVSPLSPRWLWPHGVLCRHSTRGGRAVRLHLHPSETTLSVCMDIAAVKPLKLQGLRMYRSQTDAQELAVHR